MTREQIQDKMDRLLDDNHQCLQIMHDESSGIGVVSEAKYQLESNCQQLAELHNQLREMEEAEKAEARELRARRIWEKLSKELKTSDELCEKVVCTILNLREFGYSDSEIASLLGLPEREIPSLINDR